MEHSSLIYPFSTVERFDDSSYSTVVIRRPGVRPRILLIHGIACTKEIFFLYPLMYPFTDMVAYDLRGFGTGIAKDGKYGFDDYVSDALGIVSRYSPDIIVGHSYGGAIAQEVSRDTGLPAVVMQTSANPPPSIGKEEYMRLMSIQIHRAFVDSLINYLFVPMAIPMYMRLMQYNPAMPAMDHLSELTDFKSLCNADASANIIRVMGGTKDPIISVKEVENLGKCAKIEPEFYDVNHVGVLYPSFVQASLPTTGAR